MTGYYFIIIVICLILLQTLLDKPYRKFCIFLLKRKRQYLEQADILKFYKDTSFSESAILILWHEFADTLDIPDGYLRPSDRLDKIVTLKFFTDEKIEDISDLAIERSENMGGIDISHITTVDDYIKTFAHPKQ